MSEQDKHIARVREISESCTPLKCVDMARAILFLLEANQAVDKLIQCHTPCSDPRLAASAPVKEGRE